MPQWLARPLTRSEFPWGISDRSYLDFSTYFLLSAFRRDCDATESSTDTRMQYKSEEAKSRSISPEKPVFEKSDTSCLCEISILSCSLTVRRIICISMVSCVTKSSPIVTLQTFVQDSSSSRKYEHRWEPQKRPQQFQIINCNIPKFSYNLSHFLRNHAARKIKLSICIYFYQQ